MNRIHPSFLLFLFLLPAWGSAQVVHYHCATDSMVQASFDENAHLRQHYQALEEFTRQWANNQRKSGRKNAPYIIPTVVHIIHDLTGQSLMEPEQVYKAMEVMNRDFNKQNADTSQLDPDFVGIAANPRVEFRLATLDPSGNCTNGITYTRSALTNNGNEQVKQLVGWPTNRYLNIWVVRNIASGAGAYAFYPGTAPNPNNEGIVCRATQFGNTGLSSGGNFAERTMTHELGHYFNLPHTWGSTNQPGLTTNCNLDDGVADTPLTLGVTGQNCNKNQVTCGSKDNVENYMDYSACGRMFTTGQSSRMDAALNSSAGGRNSLWQTQNLLATGTANSSTACSVKPQPFIWPPIPTFACEGDRSVDFTAFDFAGNRDSSLSYEWSFPGGTPSISTSKIANVVYNSVGSYTIRLVITNRFGESDTVERQNAVTISPDSAVNTLPLNFDFENADWPNDAQNPSLAFSRSGTGGANWQRTTQASSSGAASLFADYFSLSRGDTLRFELPSLNTLQTNVPYFLSFMQAAAVLNTSSGGTLMIEYSIDCGRNWARITTITGPGLFTTTGRYTVNYVPAPNHWVKRMTPFGFIANRKSARLRFSYIYDGANNLFIDDLRLGVSPLSTSLAEDQAMEEMKLYGNGNFATSLLHLPNANKRPIRIEVFSTTGASLGAFTTDESSIALSDHLAKPSAGLYLIKAQSDHGVKSFKWQVN